ncbi:hypothetical protein EVAR_84526_1 [Eumeta japonica]|uniref:Uncharacterized protein n=1 Tax=Eumeta variegata TaxID=151549 RepID=A0A4C1UIP3_EUMVA|nr:hypothetical protein EVAR_84526_1 [Eumeta japonica]
MAHSPFINPLSPPFSCPILVQETGNALVTTLWLRVLMGSGDRLLSGGSRSDLPLENAIKNKKRNRIKHYNAINSVSSNTPSLRSNNCKRQLYGPVAGLGAAPPAPVMNGRGGCDLN